MSVSPHIFVVDDEAAARDMVGDYLKLHGFKVTLCDGGASLRQCLAKDKPDSRLAQCIGADGMVTGRDLVEVAEAGDTDALLVFDRFARMLGIAIAGYVNVFEPDRLAIGGAPEAWAEMLA